MHGYWKFPIPNKRPIFYHDGTNISKKQVLRRKLPMAWGTTTDRVTVEINPFLYARETKHLTLKDLETYLIPDG